MSRVSNKFSPPRSRTDDLRREIDEAMGHPWDRVGRVLESRGVLLNLMIWSAFVAIVAVVVVWSREQPNVAEGRVMTRTRVARAEFSVEDKTATDQARANGRARTPRVYVEIPGVLEEIRASLKNLPELAFGVEDPERIEPGLQQQFGFTRASLNALQAEAEGGKASAAWGRKVDDLIAALRRMPILEREVYQKESQSQTRQIELRAPPVGNEESSAEHAVYVSASSALNAESPLLKNDLRAAVASAGFAGPLLDLVTDRLVSPAKPSYAFDAAATESNQRAAAAAVGNVIVKYPEGDVIYRRGEKLTETQLNKVRQAMHAEKHSVSFWQLWAPRIAAISLVTGVALALAGYTALFVPRVRRNPLRIVGVAGLLAGATILGCWATSTKPALLALTGIAPTVFVTAILAIAYNQRVALAYGCLHGILMAAALDQPIGIYAVMVAGVGICVWLLREVRHRDALIRMGIVVAITLAIGMFVSSMMELPTTHAAINQAAIDAFWAGIGGMSVSMVVLYILPTLERTFGLVTGLTLIEKRDPKQALLRQLQQRAPGTYNHSLNVASLGESAAEAIGADGLLTYVGALYHDIGKMNMPDYFVENQSPGFNRHDKLSPAMSLLVIVGHVKDGMELAREFNLPKPLHHFIESHHGTTLVEYFYHRAKRQAEAAAEYAGARGEDEEAEVPSELEYRYPGPRPRTKEAAILMICDAVESAARAMADPTPARIDAAVRAIANKRLMDGQFDECDLTLRELNIIVETVSKTLASIYHGRIQYPGNAETPAAAPTAASGPKTNVLVAPNGLGSAGTATVKERVGR